MPLISRNCLETIRERINIYDVVSPYVQLKKTGSNFRGLSPFSHEKTPSFYVLPDKGIFKCFSSGYAGDIFRFIQLIENISFYEAVVMVAEKHNFPLEYESGQQPPTHFSLKRELYQIHELATDFFHQCFLNNNNEGLAVRKYWEKERGFSLDIAKQYKIGLAPASGNVLMDLLLQKKFSLDALKKCGLFYAKDYDSSPKQLKQRFRQRLMIPVKNIQSLVIAFAARRLGEGSKYDPARDAKYINSPETPIFSKSNTLFGLDIARTAIDNSNFSIIVEGQLDAIRCWSNGINEAIAPQGTAITDQQLATLKRYTNKIISILDGDEAGQKAALRLLPMAIAQGFDIQFVKLDSGEDPDTLILTHGAQYFNDRLENTLTPVALLYNYYFKKGVSYSSQDKAKNLNAIYEVIINAESQIIIEDYLFELSQKLSIDIKSILADFNKFYKEKQGKYSMEKRDSEKVLKKSNEKLTCVEYQLLLLILNHEEMAYPIANSVDTEWITQKTIYANLLMRFLEEIKEGLWKGIEGIEDLLETSEERNLIYSMLSDNKPHAEPIKIANFTIRKLHKNYLINKKKEIDKEIIYNEKNNITETEGLQKEAAQLRKHLLNLPEEVLLMN